MVTASSLVTATPDEAPARALTAAIVPMTARMLPPARVSVSGPAPMSAQPTRHRALILEIESDADRVACTHGAAVFGRRPIMPGANLGELERAAIESSAAR